MSNETNNLTICERIREFETVPETVNKLTSKTALSLSIITPLFLLLSLFHFLWFRNKYNRLKKRSITMLILFLFGVLNYAMLVPFRDYYGPGSFPCDAYVVIAFLGSFTLIGPQVSRALSVYFRTRFNQAMIEKTFQALIGGEADVFGAEFFEHSVRDRPVSALDETVVSSEVVSTKVSLSLVGTKEFRSSVKNKKKKNLCKKVFFCWDICCWPILIILSKFVWKVAQKLAPCFYFLTCWKHPKELPDNLRLSYFLASRSFPNMLLIIIFIVQAILYSVFYYIFFAPFQGCTGCGILKFYPLQIPVQMIFFVVGLALTIAMWSFPDNLGVKQEFRDLTILFFVFYLFLVPALNTFTERYEETGEWNWSFISLIGLLIGVFRCFSVEVWIAQYLRKKESHDKTTMADVLESTAGTRAFALHCALELNLENLYFLKAVSSYKLRFPILSEEERKEQANDLVEMYISNDAFFPINISGESRSDLLEEIENDLKVDTFDLAFNDVSSLLEFGAFVTFKRSKFYAAYKNRAEGVQSARMD